MTDGLHLHTCPHCGKRWPMGGEAVEDRPKAGPKVEPVTEYRPSGCSAPVRAEDLIEAGRTVKVGTKSRWA